MKLFSLTTNWKQIVTHFRRKLITHKNHLHVACSLHVVFMENFRWLQYSHWWPNLKTQGPASAGTKVFFRKQNRIETGVKYYRLSNIKDFKILKTWIFQVLKPKRIELLQIQNIQNYKDLSGKQQFTGV